MDSIGLTDVLVACSVIILALYLHHRENRKEKAALARRKAAIKRLLEGGVWK